MDSFRKKYRVLIIVSLLVLGIAISFFNYVAIRRIEETYNENAGHSIIETKKSFLRDIVNNVIADIERKQDEQTELFSHLAEDIEKSLDRLANYDDTFFVSCAELFNESGNISAYITGRLSGRILYSSETASDYGSHLSADELKALEDACPVFSLFETAEYKVIFFATKEVIDEKVKSQIHDEIHRYKFDNDAYIWVNEVIDYNGGDNYAIRRIHPNLINTEGTYLSTSMTDIAGNHPYLTELEGVKQDGELFFNYFFKKNNSDLISEKITYAKLYEEYDWIIAMGVHLDDIKTFVDQAAAHNELNIQRIILAVAATTVLLIIIVMIFVAQLEKWYFINTKKALDNEIFRDALTDAYNRKGAENHLKSTFSTYKAIAQNAAIIMLDIDDFKLINDQCGHDKGDLVLQKMAETLTRHIRSTDYLCRWGGDEFLIICQGLKEDDVELFTDKLLSVVSELEFDCQGHTEKHHFTISMGVSRFTDSDSDYSDSVKRADKALYSSKTQGKNRVTFEQ